MKKIYIVVSLLFCCSFGFSQAILSTTEYNKSVKPAVSVEIPFPESTISDAIKDSLNKLGYKSKDAKDFFVFKGVKLPVLGSDTYDLYFNVDKKSRKDKDHSTVTLMVSKGYENFISDATDPDLIENAKTYLNNLVETVAAYDLELQIKDQNESVKKATKKLADLVGTSEDLQKKKAAIEQSIIDNTNAQAAQKAEIEKQTQILQTLLGKRKF